MSEQYREFYDAYKHKLFSYLIYKSGDYEVSRDIMQESFTRHFQHYGHDAVISPSLLFTIARNVLVDHLRQEKKFKGVEGVIPQVVNDQENILIAKEDNRMAYKAMSRLSEEDRDVLSLAVGGVAYKEIAATLGLSVANVKVRVHRTRIKLRQMIQEELE
ncbi:MAG: RNA polymerase sigma factor [Proteobacteria bacterium]|nr:RNA polymerase sigma factor [Pseudomonadota bacterium]MBU1059752.1 RNA polymerase sigma factor [Pseudomonadota bacterium]